MIEEDTADASDSLHIYLLFVSMGEGENFPRPNVPRQPVRAEHWPQHAKLASRTRLHAFVMRRPIQR
jgi:hypothetical protein